jgi:hypothetical protein
MDKYLPLRAMCPVLGCGDKTVHSWLHAGCGSNTEMNSKGRLRCSTHTNIEHSIFDWLFQCTSYSNQYMPCDHSKLFSALALTSEYHIAENKDWAEALMENLMAEHNSRKKR